MALDNVAQLCGASVHCPAGAWNLDRSSRSECFGAPDGFVKVSTNRLWFTFNAKPLATPGGRRLFEGRRQSRPKMR